MKLGERIKQRREERQITQKQLAESAGISRRNLIALETGENRNPTRSTLDAIAQVLELEMSELLAAPVEALAS